MKAVGSAAVAALAACTELIKIVVKALLNRDCGCNFVETLSHSGTFAKQVFKATNVAAS